MFALRASTSLVAITSRRSPSPVRSSRLRRLMICPPHSRWGSRVARCWSATAGRERAPASITPAVLRQPSPWGGPVAGRSPDLRAGRSSRTTTAAPAYTARTTSSVDRPGLHAPRSAPRAAPPSRRATSRRQLIPNAPLPADGVLALRRACVALNRPRATSAQPLHCPTPFRTTSVAPRRTISRPMVATRRAVPLVTAPA
jgi:hypothetical protein